MNINVSHKSGFCSSSPRSYNQQKFKINLYSMIKDQRKIKEKMCLKGKVSQGNNAII